MFIILVKFQVPASSASSQMTLTHLLDILASSELKEQFHTCHNPGSGQLVIFPAHIYQRCTYRYYIPLSWLLYACLRNASPCFCKEFGPPQLQSHSSQILSRPIPANVMKLVHSRPYANYLEVCHSNCYSILDEGAQFISGSYETKIGRKGREVFISRKKN